MVEETNVGFMDKLADTIQNLDVSTLVPEMDSVLGWIELAARLAVILGPLAMLGLGLCYMLVPAKEANHRYGYRFYWGMGSVEAWKYTQRLAGLSWSAVGLILSIVMLVISSGFRGMEAMDMVNQAVTCLIWQAVVMLVLRLVVDVLVLIRFDRKGERRSKGKGLQIPDLTVGNMIRKLTGGKKKKRSPGKKAQ